MRSQIARRVSMSWLGDRVRLGSLSGLVATFGFLLLYILAMVGHPQNPWPFNLACMVGGAFAIPFAWLALRPSLPPGRARDAGIVVFTIASVFLIQVGIFNEDYK